MEEPEIIEEEVSTQEEVIEEAPSIEDIAAELGWSPKENWRGAEEEWKPATEFLKETANINKSFRKENKTIREQLSRLSMATDAMLARDRQEQRKQWEAELREAVDMGDHEAAHKASRKIDQLETPVVNNEVADFESRHAKWYGVDPIATNLAKAISSDLHQKGRSVSEQLEEVERQVRQRFPEHFDDAPKPKPQAQVEEQGRTALPKVNKGPKGFKDLPPDAKAAALEWETKNKVPREQFAAEYWKDNA